jgi:ketosteroid isomerase-like protein
MDGVLANHADDIVRFDVPPPANGVRGIAGKDPGNRLRLTIGLRKEDGQWVVAHEHHSFPSKD